MTSPWPSRRPTQAFAAVRKHLGQLAGGPPCPVQPPNPTRPRPAAVRDGPAGSAEAVLERAGYQPELRRSLRFFSMFAIAFSIISITTGIFLNYGFGLAYWGAGRDLDLADNRGLQHDDRPGRGRTRHPHPAGRLRVPVGAPGW